MDNDLADKLDDLICAYDNGFDTTRANIESIFFVLISWAVFALGIFVLVKQLLQATQLNGRTLGAAANEELDEKPEVQIKTNMKISITPPEDVENASQTKPEIEPCEDERPVSSMETRISTLIHASKKSATLPANWGTTTSETRADLKDKVTAANSVVNGSSSRDEILQHKKMMIDTPRSLGSDSEAVAWVNDGITKAFTDEEISEELIRLWLSSLTQYTKSSGAEDGIAVEFIEIENLKNPPKISNIITQVHPGDNMTITADVVITSFSLKAIVFQINEDGTENSSDVTFALDQLRGRINLSVLSRERWLIVRFDGWPEVKARLIPEQKEHESRSQEQMFKNIYEVAKDLAVSAVRGAQININMEEFFDPADGRTPVFPAFIRGQKKKSENSSPDVPVKLRPPLPSIPVVDHPPGRIKTNEPVDRSVTHELSIRIVKAMQLGMTTVLTGENQLCPYVIVEIDEPNQRGRTDAIDISNDPSGTPHWNDEFSFKLSEVSGEVLFEVWDSAEKEFNNLATSPTPRDGFLGLAIVSIDELMITSSQRLVLPLQGRPYYSNDNDGDIVNGLLMVQFDMVDMLRKNRRHKKYRRKTPGQQTNGNTTESIRKEKNGDNEISGIEEISVHSSNDSQDDAAKRGRTKKAKRHLVSTWEKRVPTINPKNPVRSASAHIPQPETQVRSRGLWKSISKLFSGPRSVSADRVTKPFTSNTIAGAKSFLAVPNSGDDGSSMSELSGISTASVKTYIAEESSLVIETKDSGILRHYMIPFNLAERGQLRVKGKKLHVFMDHIFVAKRVRGGLPCEVCLQRLPLSFGKQGYVCRDCSLTCHKPCHVKVETHCDHTSLPAMELQLYEEN